MLAALAIRDIVIIEKLDIDFGAGLTVLTGETGAGKSILLDALSLALGSRGDAGLVRSGANQGQVTAIFEVPSDHPARAVLAEQGIGGEDELVLRRVQGSDGRTRAFVNGEPVGLAVLAMLGATLTEIHGQHDARALVDPSQHRRLLDAFGDLTGATAEVGRLWRAWRQADAAAAALRAEIDAARSNAAYLRAMTEELKQLAAQPGEEERLAGRRQAMMRSEKLAGDLGDALDIVSGQASPIPSLSGLLRRLERKRGEAGGLFDAVIPAVDRAIIALSEAGNHLEKAVRDSQFDQQELERTEERLFALRGAARKHNVPVEALPALAESFASALGALESGEGRLGEAQRSAETAAARYRERAGALSVSRRQSAAELREAVMAELPALKLERADFVVDIGSDETPGESGVDRVEFTVQTNPGARPGPLMKVASGGELSRFLLALKVALARRGSASTLIFDEVDTAVGGAVSDAIGQRLRRLSANAQVLAITHAPQVAARATHHMLIRKVPHADGERVVTEVLPLDADARREEIARMLAGSVVTDEARAAAARLLVGAG
ncbi:MAG: DNA repair protein RecN [Bauldia sp.]